jgi:hypothetical protein
MGRGKREFALARGHFENRAARRGTGRHEETPQLRRRLQHQGGAREHAPPQRRAPEPLALTRWRNRSVADCVTLR